MNLPPAEIIALPLAQAIEPFDLHRMFIGDLPWLFTLEIIARTAVMYLYTVVLIRFVARRAIGQLSLVEFLLVIALGSAVGDPMFYPHVPLLHGIAVVTVVVLLNRLVIRLINRSELVETAIEGRPRRLVHEGRMLPGEVREAHLNREKLFAMLRIDRVEHLGQIREAYLEQAGQLTVFRFAGEQERAGLRVTPPWDIEPPRSFRAGDTVDATTMLGCASCGHVRRFDAGQSLGRCEHCDGACWVDAVVEATAPGDGQR